MDPQKNTGAGWVEVTKIAEVNMDSWFVVIMNGGGGIFCSGIRWAPFRISSLIWYGLITGNVVFVTRLFTSSLVTEVWTESVVSQLIKASVLRC